MNKEKAISIDDAYDSAVNFLDKYYDETELDDIGLLAGDMHLLEWKNCLHEAFPELEQIDANDYISFDDVFTIFFNFLGEYIEKNKAQKIVPLRTNMFSKI